MIRFLLLVVLFGFISSCNNDTEAEKPILSFDYNENLMGDLSNDFNTPTALNFVKGNNTITAIQSMIDIDYFTFTVPVNHELSQIRVDDYQSTDDAGFIGIINGNAFSTDAFSTAASDLLGGLVYGIANRGTNILLDIGALSGAQGFTGNLPSGSYSVWLNQTGAQSEVSFNFVIIQSN